MSCWAAPCCETRLGASHRRRGQPCQDASGWLECWDREGRPVCILALSDGHGAARHPHSAAGSRLACQIALQQAALDLAQRDCSTTPNAEWRQWLSRELPDRIVAGWRRAVAAHWTANLGQPAASFSPIVYGATLGLLVLTPRGWGYTGLGDWDLLELSPQRGPRILSQEPWSGGDPEATHSLCLEGAERCFAARSGWRRLRDPAAPFRLLLSSDGLRKSCGSDADLFTLAQFLAEQAEGLPGSAALHASEAVSPDPGASDPAARAAATGAPPPQQSAERALAAALDRITNLGSGDDISVAIASWTQLPPDLPGHSHSDRAVERPAPAGWIVQPPFCGPVSLAALPDPAVPGVSCAAAASAPAADDRGAGPVPQPRRAQATMAWLLVGASLLGLGVGLISLLRRPAPLPFQPLPAPTPRSDRPTLSPPQEQRLRRLVAELCRGGPQQRAPGSPDLVARRLQGVLSARKASFERLRRPAAGPAADPLAGWATDPLGALIAWSADPTTAEGVARRRLARLGACEALTTALGQRWRATTGAGHVEAGRGDPAAGRPAAVTTEWRPPGGDRPRRRADGPSPQP